MGLIVKIFTTCRSTRALRLKENAEENTGFFGSDALYNYTSIFIFSNEN